MKKEIILIGGGGHCKPCIDVIEQEGNYQIAGIVDVQKKLHQKVLGHEIIATYEDLPQLANRYKDFLIVLDQVDSADKREGIFYKIKGLGGNLPVIISPLAYASPHAEIKEGTIVMHYALVNAGAVIGKNCIINTRALIEHDAIIGDHCHIATGAVINAGVKICSKGFFDSNAMAYKYSEVGNHYTTTGARERVGGRLGKKTIKTLKIGYFGDGPWAQKALIRINNDSSFKIAFVCARFDDPDKMLKQLAEENDIPFYSHANINSDEFKGMILAYNCDIFVSMSFDQIFRAPIINLPPMKTINCHAGALPFYRGRNILNWALINDEKEFGITVHYIDEGIDTGDIILQRLYKIGDNDEYATLLETAYAKCPEILYDALKLLQGYKIKPYGQTTIHPVGFYCTQRKEGDEIINWNQTSREIFNFVRALSKPGPMARSSIGKNEIKIDKVSMVEDAPVYKGINGSVIGIEKDGFLVKTSDNFIKIVKWECEGRIKIGDRFSL